MSPLIEQFTYFSNTALIDSNSKIFFAQSCHGLIFFFLWPSSTPDTSSAIKDSDSYFESFRNIFHWCSGEQFCFTICTRNKVKSKQFGETPPRNNNTTHIRGFPSLTHVPRIFIFFNLYSDIMYCVYHINTKIKGGMV